MKQKIFTLLLALIVSVGTMFASTKIGDLYYNLNANKKTAEVTSMPSGQYAGDIIIPASVDYNSVTYSVTSIGDEAFLGSYITSVEIPNSVTSIGYGAFMGSHLTSIEFPNSVTSIGVHAFLDNRLLKSITIGSGVTSIGEYAFGDCIWLTSITCKALIPPICEWNVFNRVDKSIPLYVPEMSFVDYVTADQWRDFTNLQGNGTSVRYVGKYSDELKREMVFYSQPAAPHVNGSTFVKWQVSGNTEDGIVFQAVYRADNSNAAPKVVSKPANSAQESTVQIGDLYYELDDFDHTAEVTHQGNAYSGLESVVIPPTVTYDGQTYRVTSIGHFAFRGCSGITSVTIPSSVTEIEEMAFFNCSGLTSVTIPHSVTSIGTDAFDLCSGLTSVTIGSGITSIGDYTFADCTNLTSVTIPHGVTNIGTGAFYRCSRLTSITCKAYIPPACGSSVFNKVNMSIPLYIPAVSTEDYQTADSWKDFTNTQGYEGLLVRYVDNNSDELFKRFLEFHVPTAPQMTGFTFVKWKASGDTEDGIVLQAVYRASVPNSVPEVVSAPANPAQKLLRNGQLLIQSGDRTYTLTGTELK